MHVIVLGAGASASSGYPMAQDLRKNLTSFESLVTAVNRQQHLPLPDGARDQLEEHFKSFASPINLLRNGGFASVDEFCKLIYGKGFGEGQGTAHKTDERAIRCLLRTVLGLYDPETRFTRSDYYPFIQRLFKPDLYSLNPYISLLSYNYDTYLEYLLLRAVKTRHDAVGIECEDKDLRNLHNGLTSGFLDVTDHKWTFNNDQLRFFKLHGSICCPKDKDCGDVGYDLLFQGTTGEKVEALCKPTLAEEIPPILFPWEVISNKNMVPPHECPVDEGKFYNVFKSIWNGAQHVVDTADKVSFVGLSTHPFLREGLDYLFKEKDKKDPFEVVFVNRDNPSGEIEVMDHALAIKHQHTPAARMFQLLTDLHLKFHATGNGNIADGCNMRLVRDFNTFVEQHM